MDPLLKEFAQAIVDKCRDDEWGCCDHCHEPFPYIYEDSEGNALPFEKQEYVCKHSAKCVVLKAELLLATEHLLENKNV